MAELTEYVMTRLQKEEAFVVSELKQGVAAGGGTFNVHIRNPESSEHTLMIPFVVPSSKGEATFRVYDNFDSLTDGTPAIVQNATLDEGGGTPDEGPMEVFRDSSVTPSDGSVHAGGVVGSGGGGANSLGGSMNSPPTRIEPGRELVLELTNDDTDTAYDMNILAFVMI